MNTELDDHTPISGKPAGRPKASELEARAAKLIDTASRLFNQHGYGKVSLETIAREAHVAVRTIYVKYGGKQGLLEAVMVAKRDRFFSLHDFEADTRPLRDIVRTFAGNFLKMITAPDSMCMQRMVIAEAFENPELAQTFYDAGPRQTRLMLAQFFARPDIAAQMRPNVTPEVATVHLVNCIIGDPLVRFLFDDPATKLADSAAALDVRLELFFNSVLLPV
jgi:TetR/AcrR family transcriptional repressor of mexJK operon